MPTDKQIAANRRNSQLSTGPRTEAGKTRSRMNALQSGLHAESLVIRGEDPAALAQLSAEYHAQFHPCTPRERDLVDTVVHNQWLIRRLRLIEAQLWEFKLAGDEEHWIPGNMYHDLFRRHPLAHVFEFLAPRLAYLQSRINSLERSGRRALSELRDVQQSGAVDDPCTVDDPCAVDLPGPWPPAPGPQPGPQPEIGFVPPICQAPDSPIPNPPSPTPVLSDWQSSCTSTCEHSQEMG